MNNEQSTIQLVQLQPQDVIVASHSGTLTEASAQKVKDTIQTRFPTHQILVHDSRITLSIHRPPPRTTNPA
jgi:hypothetical protein